MQFETHSRRHEGAKVLRERAHRRAELRLISAMAAAPVKSSTVVFRRDGFQWRVRARLSSSDAVMSRTISSRHLTLDDMSDGSHFRHTLSFEPFVALSQECFSMATRNQTAVKLVVPYTVASILQAMALAGAVHHFCYRQRRRRRALDDR